MNKSKDFNRNITKYIYYKDEQNNNLLHSLYCFIYNVLPCRYCPHGLDYVISKHIKFTFPLCNYF